MKFRHVMIIFAVLTVFSENAAGDDSHTLQLSFNEYIPNAKREVMASFLKKNFFQVQQSLQQRRNSRWTGTMRWNKGSFSVVSLEEENQILASFVVGRFDELKDIYEVNIGGEYLLNDAPDKLHNCLFWGFTTIAAPWCFGSNFFRDNNIDTSRKAILLSLNVVGIWRIIKVFRSPEKRWDHTVSVEPTQPWRWEWASRKKRRNR